MLVEELVAKLKENLCYYDPRNPCFEGEYNDEGNKRTGSNCFCDNCFYGRTWMAEMLLELIGD